MGAVPLIFSTPYIYTENISSGYLLGILYPLLEGSNRGVKQLGAHHPKGTSIFSMSICVYAYIYTHNMI